MLHNHLYRFANRDKGIAEPKTVVGFHSGRREVDFIIGDFGLEVKWQNRVDPSDFPEIDIKNKILLSKNSIEYDGSRKIRILPLALFLAAL